MGGSGGTREDALTAATFFGVGTEFDAALEVGGRFIAATELGADLATKAPCALERSGCSTRGFGRDGSGERGLGVGESVRVGREELTEPVVAVAERRSKPD